MGKDGSDGESGGDEVWPDERPEDLSGATAQRLRLQASPAERGKRVDAVLASHAPAGLSRSRVTSLIREGYLRADGAPFADPSAKVKGTEALELTVPAAEAPEPKPEPIPLDIVYEDQALIVINKPAGLVVHPGAGNPDGTLVNALLHHYGESLSGIGGVRRPGIVHRLDKDTSGIMVVAKTDAAHQHLSAQFADHGRTGALERSYIAYVWGAAATQTIDAPIARDRGNRLRMAVSNAKEARHAVTHVVSLATYGDTARPGASKIRCTLETGRTHQIRVHLAHKGHGLIGDQDYGRATRTLGNRLPEPGRTAAQQFPRQALQAATLRFEHPITEQIHTFTADPDPELEALERALTTV
ncbi:MAG: RluA family pseudouridine synthase [Devosiaceae bacterium]|nr:RluA family pseudouridine synthase [Devosiaceae bacterium MH13]